MALIGSGHSLGGLAGSNAIARLLVVISGDSSQLERSLAQAGGSMQGFSRNIGTVGSALTRTVTLPFLALGGAAVNAAAQYNAALARIAGLTPILDQAGISIEGVSQRLLEMANQPDVIATPTQLADAFFFAGSAGLEAATAFKVVELAAQGASIGMGSAADISKVLIFALNNFGSEGLTAAAAMDTLTAAIKEGTAEPDEMAIALGRLLPIARQAGVTFQEVVASVAALTNLGVPTRVATTSLRALFGQLLAPTIAANDRLQELGTTADELRFKLQQGPIEAFRFLLDLTKGNEDAMRTLIPQIRGMTAFLGLNTDEMTRYREVVDAVNNSQGSFQEALDKFVDTPLFQFQKGLQQLGVAGIELGNQLIPVLIQIGKVLQGMAGDFSALPGPAKSAFAVFLLAGAAIGPIFQLVGALTSTAEATGRFNTIAGQTVPSMRAMAVGFLTIGTAALVAFQSFNSMLDGSRSILTMVTGLIGSFVALRVALGALTTFANAGVLGVNRLTIALAGLSGGAVTAIAGGLALVATALVVLASRSAAAEARVEQMGDALEGAAQSGDILAEALKEIDDGGLRSLITTWAAAAGVLNRPVGEAIPATMREGAQAIAGAYETLASADFGGKLGADEAAFRSWALAAAGAAASGQDIGQAVRAAGGDMGELDEIIARIASSSLQFDEGIGGAAQSLQVATPAVAELGNALREYQQSQEAAILAKSADANAVEALADKYGVSTDFMSRKLQEFGSTAVGVMGENEDTFLQAATGVDEFGNQVSLRMQEAAEAVTEQTDNIRSAILGTFSLFEKPPKFNTKPIEHYIDLMGQWRDVSLQASQDIINLQTRGVPASLIEQLAGEGPAMLRRFADATDSELRRIVTAYQIQLAAMDQEIVEEGAHQEVKGRKMVAGFADAILKNRKLPSDAANKIILAVGAAFNRGDLTPNGLGLATDFANGLRNARNLTAKEAIAAVNEFIAAIQNKKNFDDQGRLLVRRVADGIAAATGLPKTEIAIMLQGMIGNIHANLERFAGAGYRTSASFARGVGSGKGVVFESGRGLMISFSAGIQAGMGAVSSAILAASARIQELMDQNLKASPRYFTYYAGENLMKDMQLGINRARTPDIRRPTLRDGGPGAVYRGPGGRRQGQREMDIDLYVDRRRFSKAASVDERYRGW